ncbi:MAG: phosphatidylinositol-4-phosphate 5-kinase, partial [bacterium]
KDQPSGKFKPKVQEKLFQDGSKYWGELIDGRRSNKGIYFYKNGDTYIGDWRDDKFHGHGYYIFAKGERYEGELVQGYKQGYGEYHYLNGNSYKGQWREDKKQGHGVYT